MTSENPIPRVCSRLLCTSLFVLGASFPFAAGAGFFADVRADTLSLSVNDPVDISWSITDAQGQTPTATTCSGNNAYVFFEDFDPTGSVFDGPVLSLGFGACAGGEDKPPPALPVPFPDVEARATITIFNSSGTDTGVNLSIGYQWDLQANEFSNPFLLEEASAIIDLRGNGAPIFPTVFPDVQVAGNGSVNQGDNRLGDPGIFDLSPGQSVEITLLLNPAGNSVFQVPEPSSFPLLVLGLVALAFLHARGGLGFA